MEVKSWMPTAGEMGEWLARPGFSTTQSRKMSCLSISYIFFIASPSQRSFALRLSSLADVTISQGKCSAPPSHRPNPPTSQASPPRHLPDPTSSMHDTNTLSTTRTRHPDIFSPPVVFLRKTGLDAPNPPAIAAFRQHMFNPPRLPRVSSSASALPRAACTR